MQLCKFPGCDNPYNSKEYCKYHYDQLRAGKPLTIQKRKNKVKVLCRFDSCTEFSRGNGLCMSHYAQERRGQILTPIVNVKRSKYRAEIGDIYIDNDGYVTEKDPTHPNADKRGWVKQHIKVMSEHLNRRIRTELGENVHHKNGVRDDNRIENLELWLKGQPSGQRVADLVNWARKIVSQYGNEFPE